MVSFPLREPFHSPAPPCPNAINNAFPLGRHWPLQRVCAVICHSACLSRQTLHMSMAKKKCLCPSGNASHGDRDLIEFNCVAAGVLIQVANQETFLLIFTSPVSSAHFVVLVLCTLQSVPSIFLILFSFLFKGKPARRLVHTAVARSRHGHPTDPDVRFAISADCVDLTTGARVRHQPPPKMRPGCC